MSNIICRLIMVIPSAFQLISLFRGHSIVEPSIYIMSTVFVIMQTASQVLVRSSNIVCVNSIA